jgi:hypothetical protein
MLVGGCILAKKKKREEKTVYVCILCVCVTFTCTVAFLPFNDAGDFNSALQRLVVGS